ncbi:MAG: biotin transporter BioY [Chlamydiae bacterium]|nr:biotin transporter BioY [Chlamydiota bacterium]
MLAIGYYATQLATVKTSWIRNAFIMLVASVIIALFGAVSIPLPFSPVPIAMQCQVCLFFGAFLGSKRGAGAVLLFLAQGMMGLPVMAGGAGGAHHFFGPTGGYLIGYLVGTYLCGLLWENSSTKSIAKCFLAMTVGNAFVYFLGIAWLSTFVGLSSAFVLGCLPFIVGDAVKLCIAVKAVRSFRILPSSRS